MNDSINIFIQEHRHAFDAKIPGAYNWNGVEKALERLKSADSLERHLLLNRILLDTAIPADKVWTGINEHLPPSISPLDVEDFIRQNRESLDTETPDLRVWENVTATLPAPKAIVVRVSWQRHLLRAAASIALLVVGLGAGIWYARSTDGSGMAMAEVSPEYAELEQYYEHDIHGKKEKLATFTGSQSADVLQDIEQLDRIMEELRRDLATVPEGNRPQVLRAMIENYKAKAAILERVLESLEEKQQGNNNSKLSNEIKNI
jgi:hypothetical protein